MSKKNTVILISAACAAFAAGSVAALSESEEVVTAVRAKTIHIGNGDRIDGGVILMKDGLIIAVGANVAIPESAHVINVPEASVTPGLIDANAMLEPVDLVTKPESRRRGVLASMFEDSMHLYNVGDSRILCDGQTFTTCAFADLHDDLDPGEVCPVCGEQSAADQSEELASGVASWNTTTETSSEVVPHTFVADSLNFDSPDFERLLRGGVTTVFASPDSTAVIGPRGAIVRTAGPLGKRIMREGDAPQLTMGLDSFFTGPRNGTPSGFRGVTQRTRRPNSRMGVAWVVRKAFYDAEQNARGGSVTGATQSPVEALKVVHQIHAGEVGLRVQARTQRDILTAMRLADELGFEFTLLEATEAYRCLDEIHDRGINVIYGPIYMGSEGGQFTRSFEVDQNKLTTLRSLLDAGVETALSAQDFREENGLARQAMYSMRGGLTLDEAVQCVTLTPAHLLGIEEELGSIEIGKRADLVIWSGQPFDATSKPLAVIVDGVVQYENN